MVLRSGCAFGGDFYAKQGKVATTGSSRATAFFTYRYLHVSARSSTGGLLHLDLAGGGVGFFSFAGTFR